MDQEVENLENECYQTFAEMTEQQKKILIQQWTKEVSFWILRARKYISNSQKLQESLKINQRMMKKETEASKSFNWINEIFKNRRIAASQLSNQSILMDGYVLLNKIGEIIRGQEIIYSITVTSTGKDIVSSSAGEVFTYTVRLNEFLQLLQFSSSRITLSAPSAIHKMLQNQYKKEILSEEEWSQEKIDEFTAFSSQVRSNNFYQYFQKNYQNINYGNLLEAYLRHKRNGYAIQINPPKGDKSYWSAIFHSVKNTMASPDPFYVGGDIEDEQIKGLNASVTNLNTLLINLQDVLQILTSTKIGAEQIRNQVKKSAFSNFEKSIDQTIDSITSQLLNKFTSSINRS